MRSVLEDTQQVEERFERSGVDTRFELNPGNHFTDEDLLAASEKPYAVSPSKSLERVAKRRKWEILDWK